MCDKLFREIRCCCNVFLGLNACISKNECVGFCVGSLSYVYFAGNGYCVNHSCMIDIPT